MEIVEVRCPVGPQRLLMKLRMEGGRPKIAEGNLLELACDDCKRTMRRTGKQVFRVLHRFDLTGSLIETAVE